MQLGFVDAPSRTDDNRDFRDAPVELSPAYLDRRIAPLWRGKYKTVETRRLAG